MPLPPSKPSSYPVHAAENMLANPNYERERQRQHQRTPLGFGLTLQFKLKFTTERDRVKRVVKMMQL